MHLVSAFSEGEQNRFIHDHMDMVPRIAADYRGRKGIPFEELEAEGMRALVQAARRFQGRAKFSTYATECIRGQLKDFIDAWEPLVSIEDLPPDEREKIFEWQGLWFLFSSERWTRLPASPEEILEIYEEIQGKLAALKAAFLSLSRRDRQMIEAHFLDSPRKTLEQIAREHRVSYYRTVELVYGAVKKMRSIISKIEERAAA